MDDLELSSLLCTRLCHDLVGPVGATNNGLELLAEQGSEPTDDIVALVVESGKEASRRLQFYRAAFGATRGARSLESARSVAEGMFVGSKVTIAWTDDESAAPVDHPELSRLVLNLVLCASDMLPRGGEIAVRFDPAMGGAPEVTAVGPIIKITDTARLALAGKVEDDLLDPRTVVFHLVTRLAAAMNGSVELKTPAPDTVELTARFSMGG